MGGPERFPWGAIRWQDHGQQCPGAGLFTEYGIPYYAKVDIEGSDRLCLEALLGFADRPRYVSVESDKVSLRALEEEFDLLEQLG